MTMSKEYETIDTVKQRVLHQTTRNLARLLTEEEFNEIWWYTRKLLIDFVMRRVNKWIKKWKD